MADKKLKQVVRAKVELETLMALATNDTVTAAAQQLGINRNTLYERIEKYELKDKLSEIREVATLELLTGAGKAARNLVAKIDHEDPNISVKSSTEILDRIGATKPNKSDVPSGTTNYVQIINEQKNKYGL